MSTAAKVKITESEYLAREEVSEIRHEYYRGEVFAMAGGTPEHNRIKDNLAGELYMRFGEGECQSFTSDQRVKVDASTLYTYPDIAIVCGQPEFARSDRNALTNPQVIIEVLSPATELYDRTTKFEHYKKFVSLKEYLLIAQDKQFVESYQRQSDDTWVYKTFSESSIELLFATLPIRVPMAKLYARVQFPPASSNSLRVAYTEPNQPGVS